MRVKKVISLVLIMCVVLAVSPLMSASASEADNVIRVGYDAAFTDLIEDMDSMYHKGYGYEVFQKMAEVSGLTFEFVAIDGSLVDAVNTGYVDVAGFSIRTDQRKEEVLFSATPYSKTYVALMTDDMDMRYADIESINGSTVATYPDNYAQIELDRFCEANNISVNYIYGTSANYMNMEADFYITYAEDAHSTSRNNVLGLGVYNLYLMTSFENQELMDSLNDIFIHIVYTEGNFFMELEAEYLSGLLEINHRSLTLQEVETLRQRPLEVGYVSHYQPITYTNEQGEAAGAMIDTLNAFAQRYGFEINYHPYDITDPPEEHENFDVLVTLYGDINHALEHYTPTESYYQIHMYAQVRQDIRNSSETTADMIENSPRIGILPYQNIDYDRFLEQFPNNEFVFYTEWHELLDAFAAGEVDMLIATETAALTYAELYLDGVDSATVQTDIVLPMHFLISNNISAQYLPIFNVMIDRMAEHEYEEILYVNTNAFFPQNEVTMWDSIQSNWYYYVIAFLITVLAFGIYGNYAQREKKRALKKSYNTDTLTGFMAIHKFRDELEATLEKARPNEYELISFDIDMCKTINTHFGPERGTAVIVAMADALKKAFKDTSAVITRRTAEQFLILRRVQDGGHIRDIYNTYILPEVQGVIGEKYNLSMSFGMVIISDCKQSASNIMGYADDARVQGKTVHKTTFIEFSDKMRTYFENKVNITFRMEQAVKDREFAVVYQPKISLKTLQAEGAEALVRWRPRLGDTIYPDEFIPVFEANGFIATLDLYVLNSVCEFIKENKGKVRLPRISVNLSAHTVLADNVINRISDTISMHNITPQEIELELTESAVESNTEKFLLKIMQLKKLGFAISIDDFGAGVSSLNRLSAVEADVLKLDKAFFDLKDQGNKSTVVVGNVVNMAKELNMMVVAEGVETYAQAVWLKGIACDYAQGYYFEKPVEQDEFLKILLEKKQYTLML